MSRFHLKNIRRTIFVIINGRLCSASPDLRISHGEWFQREGWMSSVDRSFMENNPRGYVDKEGIYIYQGRDARVPVITSSVLRKVIKELREKLKLDYNPHIFLGTKATDASAVGKRVPQRDIGSIIDFLS